MQQFANSFYCHFTSLFIYFNSEVAKHVQTFKETEFKVGERNSNRKRTMLWSLHLHVLAFSFLVILNYFNLKLG